LRAAASLIALLRLTGSHGFTGSSNNNKKHNNTIMTKSILKLGLLGLLAAAVAAPIQLSAQDANAPATEKRETKAGGEKRKGQLPLHGKLKAVDQTARTLTVGQHTVRITSETKIMKAGQPATLADGVEGEAVTIVYRKTDDGNYEAIKVNFGPKEDKGGEKE
jgi:hypothetical protein